MKKILIVDDEEKIRRVYGQFLVAEGFRVFGVSNFQEASAILTSGNIDMVLLDIDLSDDDGGVVCDFIHNFSDQIKVIVISVYPLREQKKMIPRACDYFEKVDSLEVLLDKIKKLFSEEVSEQCLS